MAPSVFFAAWALHLIAAASPGPTIIMAARIGLTEGFRTGMFLSLGFGIGILFWAIAALFGLSLLFQVAPSLLWGFKLAGGLFLIWIGIQMWRHATDPLLQQNATDQPRNAETAFLLGLTTQLANPKPAIFFGAVFVGTIPPDAPHQVIALLLLVIFLDEIACTLGVTRLFSFDPTRRTYARMKPRIDRVFGSVLALLGAKVALT